MVLIDQLYECSVSWFALFQAHQNYLLMPLMGAPQKTDRKIDTGAQQRLRKRESFIRELQTHGTLMEPRLGSWSVERKSREARHSEIL